MSLESTKIEPETDPIIEVRDLSVTFPMERGESRVLDNISISINDNEVLGVVGESGSGKSMFASALLDAVVEPGTTSGSITYHGDSGNSIDILDLQPSQLRKVRWEEISMVFQGAQSSFNPTKNIRSHFKETIKHHNHDMEEGMAHTYELLSDLYLEPDRVLDSYPHELSGGMKQRALIALSLVLEPNILVMDEPTAALDLLMQRSILSLLEDLKEKYDLTVIFITHDLPLVAGLADRIAVMYAFEFVELGWANQILESAAHPYTRALLRAVPDLHGSISEMHPIEGKAPDPVDVPTGCSYHPRCPLATKECETDNPPFLDVNNGHQSACFHWEKSRDSISIERAQSDTSGIVDYNIKKTQEPILSLSNLEVHFEQSNDSILDAFNDQPIVRAVDGVSLDIYENDVIAIVGESGCGKTTLGKAAIGVQSSTSGEIKYKGQEIWDAKNSKNPDISFEDIRRSLQIIHQDPGSSLNPNRTVLASLEAPLKRWESGLEREDRRDRILGLLSLVGMTPPDDYAFRYPHQLSGGEKQRVALIRALLMNPDVILADEAVSALDVSLRVEMMDLMLELQDIFNTSYLFISHNLSNARYLAGKAGGRIAVMYLGKIVEIGPVEKIINNPKHPYTKVLVWSTTGLDSDQTNEEPPVRGIDIPDPVNPPSGCRFHTRCPEAREICTEEVPKYNTDKSTKQFAACFRDFPEDHPYWESKPITD